MNAWVIRFSQKPWFLLTYRSIETTMQNYLREVFDLKLTMFLYVPAPLESHLIFRFNTGDPVEIKDEIAVLLNSTGIDTLMDDVSYNSELPEGFEI